MQATKRADPNDLKAIFLKVRLTETKTFGAFNLHGNTQIHSVTSVLALQSVSGFCVVSIGMHSSIKVTQMLQLILDQLEEPPTQRCFDFVCVCLSGLRVLIFSMSLNFSSRSVRYPSKKQFPWQECGGLFTPSGLVWSINLFLRVGSLFEVQVALWSLHIS